MRFMTTEFVLPILFTIFGATIRLFITAETEKNEEHIKLNRLLRHMMSATFVGIITVELFLHYKIENDLHLPISGLVGYGHREFLDIVSKIGLKRVQKWIEKFQVKPEKNGK